MGFRVALIAVRGIDADTLYERYGVQRTGQREEIAESPVCGATVSTGWELLYLNDYPRLIANYCPSYQSTLSYCSATRTRQVCRVLRLDGRTGRRDGSCFTMLNSRQHIW